MTKNLASLNSIYELEISESNNHLNGINEFVETKKIDMVVMIPHRYTLFEYIFHTPETKKMAFHSNVPLVALH